MIGIEVVQEVIPDHFAGRAFAAQRVSNKLQIGFQRFLTVHCAHPVHEHADDVIIEVLIVCDGQDTIVIGHIGSILAGIPSTTGKG